MSFTIIFAFLPWIVFDFLPKQTHSQMVFATTIALAVTIATSYKCFKKLFVLPCTTLIFFTVALFAVTFFNLNWLPTHVGVVTNSMCAVIIWGSLLLKRPFTIQYAKEYVSSEHWDNPVFIFINNALTISWGIIFTFNLLVHVFNPQVVEIYPALGTIFTNGTTLLGIWFCNWFPNWYPEYIKEKNSFRGKNESISDQ